MGFNHSRLFSLGVVKINTLYTERLTGYTERLAEQHSVSTKDLIVHMIFPLFKRSYLSTSQSLSTLWLRDSVALNGMFLWSEEWVLILEQLTLKSNLKFTTMLSWKDVLSPKGLLSRSRSWCPMCYADWHNQGYIIYEPLLWSLSAVTVCPIHQRALQTHCPYCLKQLPILANRSQPGFCSRCDAWLGITDNNFHTEGKSSEREIWFANEVGHLIAVAPQLEQPISRDNLASSFATCAEALSGGKLLALERTLGLSRTALRAWRDGQSLPQLGHLLSLCFTLGVSVLDFLTGNLKHLEPKQQLASDEHFPNSTRRIRSPIDKDDLLRQLEQVLVSDEIPPPSMRQVGARLGYDPSNLARMFPQQCKAISARYVNAQRRGRQQRVQRCCEEIRGAMLELHREGVYPSQEQVMARLSHPGAMWEPEVKSTWRAVLRELGFGPPLQA